MRTLCLLLTSVLLLAGCSGPNNKGFNIKNLAKSDVDMVADLHRAELSRLVRELTVKLYKRNPSELAKALPKTTVNSRLKQINQPVTIIEGKAQPRLFAEVENKDTTEAVQLAFSKDYQGDRVFALMVGITGMLNRAYNHRQEFFITDDLKHQKLYNSARNLEAINWQIRHKRNNDDVLMLLSNGRTDDGVENFSYERLFGKMIALQDMMADIVSDGSNRTINRFVQGAASMTLLPI